MSRRRMAAVPRLVRGLRLCASASIHIGCDVRRGGAYRRDEALGQPAAGRQVMQAAEPSGLEQLLPRRMPRLALRQSNLSSEVGTRIWQPAAGSSVWDAGASGWRGGAETGARWGMGRGGGDGKWQVRGPTSISTPSKLLTFCKGAGSALLPPSHPASSSSGRKPYECRTCGRACTCTCPASSSSAVQGACE